MIFDATGGSLLERRTSERSDDPLLVRTRPHSSSVNEAPQQPGTTANEVAATEQPSPERFGAIASRRRTSLMRRSSLAVAAVRLVRKPPVAPPMRCLLMGATSCGRSSHPLLTKPTFWLLMLMAAKA